LPSDDLVKALEQLRSLKPNRGYPTMAVSKFVHFANPRLVPIYDNAVIWNVAFAAFKPTYERFCRSADLPMRAQGAAFLRNYTGWAGSLIRRDPNVLRIFGQWLREQVDHPPAEIDREVETYDAAAFEMIVIGAACQAQE
jgi:hypothetical protein